MALREYYRITMVVERDPELHNPPAVWDWPELIGAGTEIEDIAFLRAELNGAVPSGVYVPDARVELFTDLETDTTESEA